MTKKKTDKAGTPPKPKPKADTKPKGNQPEGDGSQAWEREAAVECTPDESAPE